jgi:hypothetical protein
MRLIFPRIRLPELVVVELVGVVDDPCSVNDVTALPPEVITTTTCSVVVRFGVVLGIVVEVEKVVGVLVDVLEVDEEEEEDVVVLDEEEEEVVDELVDVVEVELGVLVVEVVELVVEVEDVDGVEVVVDVLVIGILLVVELELNEVLELSELSPDDKLLNLGSPLDNETVTITVTSPSTHRQPQYPAIRSLTCPSLRNLRRYQSQKSKSSQPEYPSHALTRSILENGDLSIEEMLNSEI